jgi:hypothetical protein
MSCFRTGTNLHFVFTVLVGKPEGDFSIDRMIILKWILEKYGYELDSTGVGHAQWLAVVNAIMNRLVP